MTSKFEAIFGIMLLLIVAGLIAMIGLGHVEEKSSYGLMPIIVCFAQIAGAYCNKVFAPQKKEDNAATKDIQV
jgi:hypothetical protein